eukprot:scaffold14392_cov151-Skeletonema_menzelii.AAC.12
MEFTTPKSTLIFLFFHSSSALITLVALTTVLTLKVIANSSDESVSNSNTNMECFCYKTAGRRLEAGSWKETEPLDKSHTYS